MKLNKLYNCDALPQFDFFIDCCYIWMQFTPTKLPFFWFEKKGVWLFCPALPVMVVDMLCQVLLQGFVDQAAHCTAAPIEKD